jgi:hypothetical protein
VRGPTIDDRLAELAESDVPNVDPAYVARLEAHLRTVGSTPSAEVRAPASRRRRSWRVVALAAPAAAVAAAAAALTLPSAPRPSHVTADPGVTAPAPPTTATEAPATTSTTAPLPAAPPPWAPPRGTAPATLSPQATAVGPRPPVGAAPAPLTVPTSTPAPAGGPGEPVHATTTTVAPTPPPASPESLNLQCIGSVSSGAPEVLCSWSHSTATGFASYRLTRERPGTNRVTVATITDRGNGGYADRDVQAGADYSYIVEALDGSGAVVGRSGPSTVSCC